MLPSPPSDRPPSDGPLESGALVCDGAYRIERFVGPRGHLRAYDAVLASTDRPVLLLELPPGASGPERERFLDAARRLAGPRRPGLPEPLGGFAGEHRCYTAWEACGGQAIEEVVAGRPLPGDAVARHLHRLAAAVHGCHSVGCLHLGLDGQQVRITPAGDLAVPPPVGATGEAGDPRRLLANPYQAPELVQGMSPTAATDAYAVGALAHLMLFGEPPPMAADRISGRQPVALRSSQGGRYHELGGLCVAALDLDPRRRATLRDLAHGAALGASTRPLRHAAPGRGTAWGKVLAAPLIERIGSEPEAPRSELGWRADRLRWAQDRARTLSPERHAQIEATLRELLVPVTASHPNSGVASEWGCLAVLVAVFVWFVGVVATLGSVAATSLVVGSAVALAALAGVVLGVGAWHRRQIRAAIEAIGCRFPDPSERDDAIAVLYEIRESSLAAAEVLEALEGRGAQARKAPV